VLFALSGCITIEGKDTSGGSEGGGSSDCEPCDGEDNDGDGLINEDYPDTDGDGTADCVDPEECDGVDNNGDGEIDEGYDDNGNDVPDCLEVELCNCEDDDLDGEVDEGCEYTISMTATSDDEGEYFFDGASWFSSSGWAAPATGTMTVGAGTHHIAAHSSDNHNVVAGFLAAVYVDGDLLTTTGEGAFMGTSTTPASGWETSTSGMTADSSALCSAYALSSWYPITSLASVGADWVWFGGCENTDLVPENWFVLELEVCGEISEPEYCDGVDNDMDGEVDEGWADTDGDGLCDLMDPEECDGLDNDGNGLVDEYFEDTDMDGIADCVDEEECDEYDNDGDGELNEGFLDSDEDGVMDCIDTEDCDGRDNDGDGSIDEDFIDTDGDGTADCMDAEECDGIDNDGDGVIDNGMSDTDGDGICDALDEEECDGLDNNGNGRVDEGYPDLNGNGVADCIEPETACDCRDNNGNGEVDEDCEYELSMVGTADDQMSVWLDGANWFSTAGWASPGSSSAVVNGGTHYIAAHAWDNHRVYAGFRAEVYVDGDLVSATGDGSWMGSATNPGTGWETSTSGLSAEVVASCGWGSLPAFTGGSSWVWAASCSMPSTYLENWYVLELDVCGEEFVEELCDGVDNDGDGLTDEDYIDTDGDSIADCVDTESCYDFIDNDGDGETDEDCYGDCGPVEGEVNVCVIEGGYYLYCSDTSTRTLPIRNLSTTLSGSVYQTSWEVDMSRYSTMIVDAPTNKVSQWGLHIGNSPTNDGNGGDGSTFSNDSEFQTYGSSVALYADDYGATSVLWSNTAAINVSRDHTYTVVCDEYLGFESDTVAYTDISSPYIFQIDGDEVDAQSSTGMNDQLLYLGLNRVVYGSGRTGQGYGSVKVYLIP
jgi:hypothetical protein